MSYPDDQRTREAEADYVISSRNGCLGALPVFGGWHEPEEAAQALGTEEVQECEEPPLEELIALLPESEAEKFMPNVSERMKQHLGGMQIISLGESFTSKGHPGEFVPYEIRLKHGSLRKHNLALKKHGKTGRWYVDGGL